MIGLEVVLDVFTLENHCSLGDLRSLISDELGNYWGQVLRNKGLLLNKAIVAIALELWVLYDIR
jgi:hypothetical protein